MALRMIREYTLCDSCKSVRCALMCKRSCNNQPLPHVLWRILQDRTSSTPQRHTRSVSIFIFIHRHEPCWCRPWLIFIALMLILVTSFDLGCRMQELLYDKQKLLQNGDRCCSLHRHALLGRFSHKCAQAQCTGLVAASGSDVRLLMQLQDILDI